MARVARYGPAMNPVTGLSLGRIAIGALSLARPSTAAVAFGLTPAAQPEVAYVTRLFGSRETALGTATLLARGKGRTALVLLGVGVDVADAVTGHLGPREGQVTKRAGATLLGPALGAAAAGVLGLRTGGSATPSAEPAGRGARKAAAKAAKKATKQAGKQATKQAAKSR